MSKKINPIAFRAGLNHPWRNLWFTTQKRLFSEYVVDDILVTSAIKDHYRGKNLLGTKLERVDDRLIVTLFSDKVSQLIGKKGAYVESLRSLLNKVSSMPNIVINVENSEVPLTADYISSTIAYELGNRRPLNRIVRYFCRKLDEMDVHGYKIEVKGRLEGSDKTKKQKYGAGRVPLQSIKYPIDYSYIPARTNHGIISVKTWICQEV